jgi:crotonobetainyl-CoA:carnitine CoA-transferase CaiB-like acyl-CoA transferase
MTALSHVRVVDLTHHIAGPYCTKLMAGFGAEVIKIERPKTGDPLRSIGPFAGGKKGLERSIPFLWYNTGKKSVTLDLKSARGIDICKRLVEEADIVVENFAPGVMGRLGLSYETLHTINPRIVLTSISNFGQTGPYRNYQSEEITEYAMSGAMYATGDPGQEPLAAGPAITQISAGMMAYVASLMGYFRSVETGVGDWIDLSIHEAALNTIEVALAEFLHLGKVAKRTNDEHALVPWQIYPCRDGHAAIIGSPIRHWLKGAELFKQPELTSGKYDHVAKRIANRDQIRKLMAPWLSANNKKDIFHAGAARGLAFSYLASLNEVLESSQHEARKFFVATEHPETGTHKMAGAPFRPQKTPWCQHRAPLLGEHTGMILSERLQLSCEEITQLQSEGVA